MTEAERQEKREEVRQRRKVWNYVAFGVLAGGFALMSLSASWVVVRSANERQAICEASAAEREVLRGVLRFARDTQLARPDLDAATRLIIRTFYSGALAKAPPLECSNGTIGEGG